MSKFNPETSVEEIIEHIVTETSVKDKKLFRCIKLVKKDQDISKLSWVSFKIDVVAEHFDELMDSSNWGDDNLIREFIHIRAPEKQQPIGSVNSPLEQQPAKTQKTNNNDLIGFNTPNTSGAMDIDKQSNFRIHSRSTNGANAPTSTHN